MKLFNKYILFLLTSFLLLGCTDDFVDRPDLISENAANFYQNESDAILALAACYDGIQLQNDGDSWVPYVTISDVLSDHAYAGGSDANDGMEFQQLNQFKIPTEGTKPASVWAKNYMGIFRANILLEELPGMDVGEEFAARLTAEAKFCRAYCYFELLKFFENVPLLTETIKGDDYYVPLSDPVDTYGVVATDLYEAIQDLPETLPSDEVGRVTKWAAQSFLARVFLFYNGVYGADLMAGDVAINSSTVLAELEDVIANSGHELLPDYADIFRLASEYSVESVFEIGYGDNPGWGDWDAIQYGEGNLAAQMQGPRAESGEGGYNRGWSFAPVSHKLVEKFDPADTRLDATILNESEVIGGVSPGFQHTSYYSQKYTSDEEHWGLDGSLELNRTCNYRVIRFADVLLMAAELGSPNAQDYLDRVRTRAGVASIPATAENIYNERELELALEGHRYFDVLRKGLDYAEQELTQVDDRGPNYEGEQVNFNSTFNRTTKGFFPIPQAQINLALGQWAQNAGY